MPWLEMSIMEQRGEFVMLFEREGANRRELCRRFGISPQTGYALVHRYRRAGEAGLADRPRRPKHSPGRTPDEMEALVLSVRDEHPAWGGRKIGRRLGDLGHDGVPSASTITEILRRHGRLDETGMGSRTPPQRARAARISSAPTSVTATAGPAAGDGEEVTRATACGSAPDSSSARSTAGVSSSADPLLVVIEAKRIASSPRTFVG